MQNAQPACIHKIPPKALSGFGPFYALHILKGMVAMIKTNKTSVTKSRAIALMLAALLALCATECRTATTSSTASSEASQSATQVITDLAGRKNTLPKNITRISIVHPIPCQMVWRLAPNKLASVDKQFDDRLEFMNAAEQKRIKALPVTGEFHSGLSAEQIISVNPQVVVSLTKDTDIDTEQKSFNIPVVAASKDTLPDIAKSWRFIGKLVGNEKEGNALGDYWDSTVKMVTAQTSKIKKNNKLKVYYAQSTVTNTVGTKTIMASVIDLAGGISFMEENTQKDSDATNESIPVSMEDICKWDPDVIITATESGKEQILASSMWKNMSAVKNNRVYASTKYEMLDRTQSLMGLLWTAKTLYPSQITYDLNKEVRTFYSKVYLDNNVTDDEITKPNS